MDESCESHSQVQSQGFLKSVRLVASLQPLQCTCKVSSQVPVKLCSIGFDADCMRRNVERCLQFQIRYVETYQDQSYAAAVDSKCIFSWTASERMWL